VLSYIESHSRVQEREFVEGRARMRMVIGKKPVAAERCRVFRFAAGGLWRKSWPKPWGFVILFSMTQAALTRSLKQALAASLRDHRDDVRDLLAEVIEDVALASAIRDGENSKSVKRESVMKALRDAK
jgi:hypothetical protein